MGKRFLVGVLLAFVFISFVSAQEERGVLESMPLGETIAGTTLSFIMGYDGAVPLRILVVYIALVCWFAYVAYTLLKEGIIGVSRWQAIGITVVVISVASLLGWIVALVSLMFRITSLIGILEEYAYLELGVFGVAFFFAFFGAMLIFRKVRERDTIAVAKDEEYWSAYKETAYQRLK